MTEIPRLGYGCNLTADSAGILMPCCDSAFFEPVPVATWVANPDGVFQSRLGGINPVNQYDQLIDATRVIAFEMDLNTMFPAGWV